MDALAGGWDAFVTMLRWIAVAFGAVLPFLAADRLLVLVWLRLCVRAAGAAAASRARPAAPAAAGAGCPDRHVRAAGPAGHRAARTGSAAGTEMPGPRSVFDGMSDERVRAAR